MLTHDTLRKLNEMKLFGMAQGFEDQLASAAAAHLSFEERFGLLTDQEMTFRENRRLRRLLRNAKLRESACIEDVDYRTGRGLERSEIASLALCNWIRHGINLIVSGATGSGKTWMGCAFGNQACRQGLTVLFQRLPLLLEELAVSLVEALRRNKAEEEVRKMNLELEKRVVERTEDLAAKTAELERINRVFVDRELKMRELKARIIKLEEKELKDSRER